MDGLQYAIEHGAKISSASIGKQGYPDALRKILANDEDDMLFIAQTQASARAQGWSSSATTEVQP